jgi:hypothetical protein
MAIVFHEEARNRSRRHIDDGEARADGTASMWGSALIDLGTHTPKVRPPESHHSRPEGDPWRPRTPVEDWALRLVLVGILREADR